MTYLALTVVSLTVLWLLLILISYEMVRDEVSKRTIIGLLLCAIAAIIFATKAGT